MDLSESSVGVLNAVTEALRSALMRIIVQEEDSLLDTERFNELVGTRAMPLRLSF